MRLIPEYFIFGIAPLGTFLDEEQKEIIFSAMKKGMNIVNGLPEFFTDDEELEKTICEYEYKYELPTTDILKHGCDKLIFKLYEVFPGLQKQTVWAD